MIKELAIFEEALDQVQATEQSLLDSLTFAPTASDPTPTKRVAQSFILEVGGRIAGMALYFYNYSTWRSVPGVYLEDLFVRPDYRRKGYANLLLQKLAQEAVDLTNGKGRLEFSCLRNNYGALAFYEHVGGIQMTDWVGIRFEGERLLKLASHSA